MDVRLRTDRQRYASRVGKARAERIWRQLDCQRVSGATACIGASPAPGRDLAGRQTRHAPLLRRPRHAISRAGARFERRDDVLLPGVRLVDRDQRDVVQGASSCRLSSRRHIYRHWPKAKPATSSMACVETWPGTILPWSGTSISTAVFGMRIEQPGHSAFKTANISSGFWRSRRIRVMAFTTNLQRGPGCPSQVEAPTSASTSTSRKSPGDPNIRIV